MPARWAFSPLLNEEQTATWAKWYAGSDWGYLSVLFSTRNRLQLDSGAIRNPLSTALSVLFSTRNRLQLVKQQKYLPRFLLQLSVLFSTRNRLQQPGVAGEFQHRSKLSVLFSTRNRLQRPLRKPAA